MQLVARAPRGLERRRDAISECEEEFARFVAAHAASAWRAAHAVLGDREDAIHAIRHGLDEAWQRSCVEQPAITRVVLRSALDALSRRGAPTYRLTDLLPAFSAEGALTSPPLAWPRDRVERLERTGCIPALIRRLPEPQRAALLLRDRLDLSAADAARVLDRSEGEVREALREGRLALHALIGRRLARDDDASGEPGDAAS